jgi:hypothetical protein
VSCFSSEHLAAKMRLLSECWDWYVIIISALCCNFLLCIYKCYHLIDLLTVLYLSGRIHFLSVFLRLVQKSEWVYLVLYWFLPPDFVWKRLYNRWLGCDLLNGVVYMYPVNFSANAESRWHPVNFSANAESRWQPLRRGRGSCNLTLGCHVSIPNFSFIVSIIYLLKGL